LNPKKLDEEGMEAALRDFLSLPSLSMASVELDIADELPGLAPWQRSSLFRFVQESITNARKHSEATEIRVSLHPHGNRLAAKVQDNGVGFDLESIEFTGHGLQGLKQKAELLEAELSICSTPGEGTKLELSPPVARVDCNGSNMAFTFVLGLAALFQVVAVLLALRLNTIYRRRYAWLFISGAGILMTLWIGAGLFETIQDPPGQVVWEPTLWVQTLATLLTAILFFSGIATIEPLFKENEAARALLATENAMLNREVQHSREEMQLAQRVQANLLPKHAPDFPGLDIAFLSRPAEWTSGDYFDFVQIDEDTLIVTVADVCGHGLGPALLMTTSRSYFRGIARTRKECQPIVNTWNHAIAEDIEAGDFMTALVVRLDLAQQRI
ncbi:liaS, partial [Symbiodinium microadriaticum]